MNAVGGLVGSRCIMIEGSDIDCRLLDPLFACRSDHHAGRYLWQGIIEWYDLFSAREWIAVRFSMTLTIFRLSSFLRVPTEDHQHAADVHG